MKANKLRKVNDFILNTTTYLFSTVSLVTLSLIVFFIFSNGFHLLNYKLITENFESQGYVADLYSTSTYMCDCETT